MFTMSQLYRFLARAATVLVLLSSPLAAPAASLAGCCLEEQSCCVVGAQKPCGSCSLVVTSAVPNHTLPDVGGAALLAFVPPARLGTFFADIWRPPPPPRLT
jgi:hypothetical protein